MARILNNEELKHLTIPRLQALLKAARARSNAFAYCDICHEHHVDEHNADRANKLDDYVNRIKNRLHELQTV